MLMGEFHHNIDEKGRLIVPAKLRNELGESYVICKGMEDNLLMYSLVEWSEFVNKLSKLPITLDVDADDLTRHFLGSAYEGTFDKQGRVLIPTTLRKHAKLDKEIVLLGVLNKVEIWNKSHRDEKEVPKEKMNGIRKRMKERGMQM